jgi:hypothetical protein
VKSLQTAARKMTSSHIKGPKAVNHLRAQHSRPDFLICQKYKNKLRFIDGSTMFYYISC